MEINVRRTCFHPSKTGDDDITLSGFTVKQAATNWTPPTAYQEGMVGPHWSKGWIIEDSEISDSRFSLDSHIVKADSIDSSIIGTEYGQAMPAIGVCENRPEEYAFSISWNDFVAAFNALYEKDWGQPFFLEESNWISRQLAV